MRSRTRGALFAALLLLLTAHQGSAAPALVLIPGEWAFGSVTQGTKLSLTLGLQNSLAQAVWVSVIPTTGSLSAQPPRLRLEGKARGTVLLTYETADAAPGDVEASFIITADSGRSFFTVRGTVVPAAVAPAVVAPAGRSIPMTYYYTPGCKTCERFLAAEVPRLERALGVSLSVEKRDVLDPAVFKELTARTEAAGVGITAFPVLLAAGRFLQGEAEIRRELEPLLRRASSGEGTTSGSAAFGATVGRRLAALPVLAGGLLDGVNPCAFTTLIFLLASLALAGRGRREVLLIGALFSLSVFLTYLGIGLGFFAVLRAATGFPVVSLVLRWVLFAVLVGFAGLSFYDFAVIRAGRPTEILLQLPTALKRQIHRSIRARARSVGLAASSLVLGFLVSIFEFACTGQVYLPTLAYLVRLRGGGGALPLLLLYNLGFIAPLLAVFGASYLGVGSERITRLFQRRMGVVKLGLGVFFLGLAAFTLAG